jgi:hypothetical protein
MADERRTSRSHNYRDDRNRDRGYKMSHDSDDKRDKFEGKAPPEFAGKPCHVHGDKAKHTYQECHDNPNVASRAVAIATTTTESATMMRTIMTNAISVAKTSLRMTIIRQSRATMKERNRAQAAEMASATKKITMLILVKYLEKRGRLAWSKGLHLVRKIFEMRSHLIPRSM